jgi:hypothetical protein
VRTVGALLRIGCIVATWDGHAVFFVMAQKDAAKLQRRCRTGRDCAWS